jgi:uncharacterized protein YndB with AHSA1/START domain
VVDHDLRAVGRITFLQAGSEGERHDSTWKVIAADPPRHLELRDADIDDDGRPNDGNAITAMIITIGERDGGGAVMAIRTHFDSRVGMEKVLATGFEEGMRSVLAQIEAALKETKPIEVSRRIEAPAAAIFEILANPRRHVDFDGSNILRGAVLDRPISDVGDPFTMKMHRLGDDYLMLNHVVEFEPDRRIFWEPGPGDPSRAEGNDPSKVGTPAGYRWGYILPPDGDDATVVTEVFDFDPLPEDLLRDGGEWIDGTNSVLESLTASLERLEKISTE